MARAVLFQDATLAPIGGPRVGVVAVAKKDLAAGELIEQFGGYQVYGVAENIDAIRGQRLLPVGLSLGCKVNARVSKDAVLTVDDVWTPQGRLVDLLYAEQERFFVNTTASTAQHDFSSHELAGRVLDRAGEARR